MKKFRFRLQVLLKAKEHIEREKQKEHATALKQVYDQRRRQGEVSRHKLDTIDRQRHRLSDRLSVAGMLIHARYVNKLKRDLLAGDELLRAFQKMAGEKHQALLKASKERKVFEKLRDRRRRHFDEKVRMLTTKENDEIAINSFLLKEG
jgi:flagellar FliJ protein